MKVIQEKLPASQIGLEIEIPAEISQSTYEKVLQNLVRSTNIPGFRKGKIPRQVLIQRLGKQAIKATVIEELIQKGLESALEQESLETLGSPKLLSPFDDLIQAYEPGRSLTFSASVEVPPTITLGEYTSLAITAEESPYKPENVENWLSEKQTEQATLVPVEDRSAQMGDVAIIDYSGKAFETGEELEDVRGEDLRVDLEEGRFIEGMVEGIVGMKPEEVKDLPLTFPEDYPKEELSGKPVIFSISLKELKAKELPELDDDFAQEVSEYETIAELQESLEKRFQEQAEKETKNNIHSAITAELVKDVSVDLPETMIQEEISQILTQTFMQMEQMGFDVKQLFTPENIPKMRENARNDAIKSLKQTLAIQEVAKIEKIEADLEAIEEKIASVMKQVNARDIDTDRLQEVVTEEILTEKTLSWLQEKAIITLVPEGSLTKEADSAEGEMEVEVEAEAVSEEVEVVSEEE